MYDAWCLMASLAQVISRLSDIHFVLECFLVVLMSGLHEDA